MSYSFLHIQQPWVSAYDFSYRGFGFFYPCPRLHACCIHHSEQISFVCDIRTLFSHQTFWLLCTVIWLFRMSNTWQRQFEAHQTREELGAEETVVQKIKGRRLQWFGHVERMEEKRLPNAALHGHVEGKRSRGRPGWTMSGKIWKRKTSTWPGLVKWPETERSGGIL